MPKVARIAGASRATYCILCHWRHSHQARVEHLLNECLFKIEPAMPSSVPLNHETSRQSKSSWCKDQPMPEGNRQCSKTSECAPLARWYLGPKTRTISPSAQPLGMQPIHTVFQCNRAGRPKQTYANVKTPSKTPKEKKLRSMCPMHSMS